MRYAHVVLVASLLAAPLEAQEAPPPAATPPSPVDAIRERTLTGRSANAAGKTLGIGAGRYELAKGRLWEVAAKDGRPLGAFFEGKGTLTFRPDDPQAGKLAVRNAKHVGAGEAAEGTVTASFEAAELLFSEALRPAWEYEAAGPDPAPEAKRAAHARRFRQDRVSQVEARLAVAELGKGKYLTATIEAGEDLRHVFDAATDDEEELLVVDRPPGLPIGFPEARFAEGIGRQPIGRTRREAPRVDVRLVAVDVDVRDGGEVFGTLKVTETFVAERPVAALVLSFDGERYVKSKLLEPRMKSLTDGEGRPLAYALGRGDLVVFLPAPAPKGARLTLKLEYEAPYFERVGGDNVWELPIATGWYPQPEDHLASAHTFHAVVRTRKPFVAFASGDTVRRAEEDGWNVLETRLDRPVPFATVLAGKFTVQESTEDGVTCRIASYGVSKEMGGKKLLSIFHGVRKFYAWLLGPFPWKEFTIVEINDYGFGQAPPGMMRITREAFQTTVFTEGWAALFSQGINQRLAHELAHGYFGYVVDEASPNHQWISEAFSEAVSMYAIERLKDEAEGRKLAGVWRGAAGESTKAAPIYLANELATRLSARGDDSTDVDRFQLVYSKGAVLLYALRKELGDDLFFTVLRSFLRSFEKRRSVTTDDFVALLEYATKRDWKPWFEKYYYGTEMP